MGKQNQLEGGRSTETVSVVLVEEMLFLLMSGSSVELMSVGMNACGSTVYC